MISRLHFGLELADRGGANQVDGTTSEAATGHARADDAALSAGKIDNDVEFAAADLVIIFHALVGFGHAGTDGLEIAILESFRDKMHANVFGNDMAAAAVDQFRQVARMRFELAGRDIAESLDGRKVPLQKTHA